VAMSGFPCTIKICFGDGSLFKSAGFLTTLEKDTCKEERLLPMLGDDELTKKIIEVAKGLKIVLEVLIGSGPVLSFFLGFAMINVWVIAEGAQLFVHYPMLEVDASSNLGIF
jgi:hypothetical protein